METPSSTNQENQSNKPQLSEEENQALIPSVLALQKLLQNKLQTSQRSMDAISVTSCESHSCN